ncbi:hypothetical protein FR932_18765 [Moritella marina ATCC 15381]|uniref:Uncharacterized protein n=1 Tax=Moritella marina ATCC 15381 TaxID=1202962 RepID=A0A5J6WQN5_MORMI|nr:hypothetical protein [Moritella marina]QFI39704.1 hypothetical protein FR932_18765 [Moritella marina ATCC 15381]
MALVIPPPTAIPNTLNPTTAAVERDAEKREITPAVTPDSASASTNDSTAEKDLIHYSSKKKPKKNDPDRKKKSPRDPSLFTDNEESTTVVIDHIVDEDDRNHTAFQRSILSIDMEQPPETMIAELLLLRQAILAKATLDIDDRGQLGEINYTIKTALADLLRLKQLDEVKVLAAQLPSATGVLKGDNIHSHVVSLDDLFASTVDDAAILSNGSAHISDHDSVAVSAKSKLAGAVVGYFYGENIEPHPPSQIDHKE